MFKALVLGVLVMGFTSETWAEKLTLKVLKIGCELKSLKISYEIQNDNPHAVYAVNGFGYNYEKKRFDSPRHSIAVTQALSDKVIISKKWEKTPFGVHFEKNPDYALVKIEASKRFSETLDLEMPLREWSYLNIRGRGAQIEIQNKNFALEIGVMKFDEPTLKKVGHEVKDGNQTLVLLDIPYPDKQAILSAPFQCPKK